MPPNDYIGIDCKERDAYWESRDVKLNELAIKNYFLPTTCSSSKLCDNLPTT